MIPFMQSFEQDELEALTLQLIKMKELLRDSRCQISSQAEAESILRSQLAGQEQLLQQLQEQQLKKNDVIEKLSAQISALEDVGIQTNQRLQERENDLLIAQQHLAKKVREVTRLHEQLEETDQHAKVLQNETNRMRLQAESLKNELNRWQKREAQLLEQLHELTVTAEDKQSRLEADCQAAAEQWKNAEAQLHKLRLLEEQQQQLRALLVDMGQSPPISSQERDELTPAPPMRMRQNLFDNDG